MLRAIGWFLWGIISLIHSYVLRPIGQALRWLFRFTALFAAPVRWLCRAWRSGTDELRGRAQRWALRMENSEIRRLRRLAGFRLEEGRTLLSDSVVEVYSRLRLYTLTGEWQAPIQRSYLLGGVLMLGAAGYAFLVFVRPLARVSGITLVLMHLVSGALLFASCLIWRSTLKQVSARRRWTFRALVWVPLLWWVIMFAPVAEQQGYPAYWSILPLLCLACLMLAVCYCAPFLQWRVFSWYTAFTFWLTVDPWSAMLQDRVNLVTAWLLHMAPDEGGKFGWRSTERLDRLMEVSRLEREGAEWRGLILPALGLVSLANFTNFLPSEDNILGTILSFANPVIVMSWLVALLVFWSAAMSIVLSEYPNRVVALACAQAKDVLARTRRPPRQVGLYRVITARNADSFPIGAESALWAVAARQPLPSGACRYLVRAMVELDDMRNEKGDGEK